MEKLSTHRQAVERWKALNRDYYLAQKRHFEEKRPRGTERKQILRVLKRMSTNRVRPQVKAALDQAIQARAQPTPPRNGIGLVLKTPTGRFRTLVDKKGLTGSGGPLLRQD